MNEKVALARKSCTDEIIAAIARGETMQGIGQSIQNSLGAFTSVSSGLYRQLLPEEARRFLNRKRSLYIIPTGSLYGLPFEALVSEEGGENPRYLIEDFAVTYLSSASMLKILGDVKIKRDSEVSRERGSLLAFADPSLTGESMESTGGERTRAYMALMGGGSLLNCLKRVQRSKRSHCF